MLKRFQILNLIWLLTLPSFTPLTTQQEQQPTTTSHAVQAGDTWLALAWRYGTTVEQLQTLNPHPNPLREPTIGSTIMIPGPPRQERMGQLLHRGDSSLLGIAVASQHIPWQLALLNQVEHPYRPLLYRSLFIPGGDSPPQVMPPGLSSLQLSAVPAIPGQAIGWSGQRMGEKIAEVTVGSLTFELFESAETILGLTGSGAFFPPEDHLLTFRSDNGRLWSQPWRFAPGQWTFQEITLTGDAAAISQEDIIAEQERLDQLWQQRSPEPYWATPFQEPIRDHLEISSDYGARRSYNGGPYRTYHEGVDYSAYGGTAVYAPAAGQIVLAERLYVRGGAVIIDHGLGVYSGFYHLSEVLVEADTFVEQGALLGEVGSTGFSTGNHLHWDLLVNGTWIDGAAWLEQELGCWILAAWGNGCRAAGN